MALSAEFVGRTYRADVAHIVSVDEVHAFLHAIGEPSGDIAPPTFAIKLALAESESMMKSSELGLDWNRVVHGDQRFEYHRPIRVGDALDCETVIDAIKSVAGNDIITTRCDLTSNNELVVRSWAVLFFRGPEK
ncbi:MAG: hypothetical protein EBV30_07060 [Actinobacteria bacterium]|jgi:N-terminal half of MaoC dehydratase|nr:hypothetical protein [Actinomycetota bacterium]